MAMRDTPDEEMQINDVMIHTNGRLQIMTLRPDYLEPTDR